MFSARLKNLRTAKNITQKDLALLIGLDRTSVTKWETKGVVPDPQTLSKLASFFAVTTDYLLGVSDDPRPHNPSTGKEASARETRQLEQLLEMDGLTFKGAPLSEDDRNKIKAALEIAFWDAKEKNKKK